MTKHLLIYVKPWHQTAPRNHLRYRFAAQNDAARNTDGRNRPRIHARTARRRLNQGSRVTLAAMSLPFLNRLLYRQYWFKMQNSFNACKRSRSIDTLNMGVIKSGVAPVGTSCKERNTN